MPGSASLTTMQKSAGGLRWMALSAFWFSVMSALVKAAGARLPYQEMVFARGVGTLVLSLWGSWQLKRREPSVSMLGNRRWLLVVRGLLGFVGLNCYYFSLTALSLGDASIIQNTSPIITAIIAGWWLGERAGRSQLLVALIAFAGVLIVAQPPWLFGDAAPHFQWWSVGVALVGAFVAACSYVAVRVLSQTERHETILLYFPLVATVLTLPLLPGHWLNPTPVEWLLLIGIGVSTQLAQVAMTKGLALEPAGRAMTMAYLQVALALGWGAFLFKELPSATTLSGAACIVLALLALPATRSASHR